LNKLFVKKAITGIFYKIPFFVLEKAVKTNLIVPQYHMVSNEEVPHVKHLYTYRNVRQFKDDIDFFLRYYSPISLYDLINSRKNDRDLPEESFLLTFDDGLREQYDIIAPILIEKGIPATFFLTIDFLDNKQLFYRHKASILIEHVQKSGELNSIDEIKNIFSKYEIKFTDLKTSILSVKYNRKHVLNEIALLLGVDFDNYLSCVKPFLNTEQVKELVKDGFTIGAHSIDHPLYSSLSLEEQLYQTKESINRIKEKFLVDYGAFAFPHTDFGVSKKFFEEILGSGFIDVSFGTSGMKKDIYKNNLQRIDMEDTLLPAEKIIAKEYGKKILNVLTGRDEIKRN